MSFPAFDENLPSMDRFISELTQAHQNGKITSWDELEERVKAFFTPECMDQIDSIVPGWKRMASYSDGITLTHVMCVFLGLFLLPEYRSLNHEQQQLAKWIVLFHDVEKIHIRGQRDYTHGFRSAALTAGAFSNLGFPVREGFDSKIMDWQVLTSSAIVVDTNINEQIQDNTKLPDIIAGIATMFGEDSPASLIVKGVLFHMSLNVVKAWPQTAPLTNEEFKRYINIELAPLLKVMNLSDNEGWVLFESRERAIQRENTLAAFREFEPLLKP